MKFKQIAMTSVFGLIAASASHAALLAYDGFGYNPGSANGTNGGSGAWDIAGSWAADSAFSVASGSLSYPGLAASSGNRIDAVGSWSQLQRDLDVSAAGLNDRVWFSFLIRRNDSASGFAEGVLHEEGNVNWAYKMQLEGTGVPRLNHSGPGANVDGSGPLTVGQTYLFVGSYDPDGSGLANFWVNPTNLGGVAPGPALQTMSQTTYGLAGAVVGGVRFYAIDANWSMDEVRLGTDYASVTPIPEASTALLGALGALGLLRRRRA